MKDLKLKNANKLVIGHLNINYIRYKFDCLKYIIDGNIDILLLSETKVNGTYPDNQFLFPGFHIPFRADRTERGGGLLLFVREHLPVRQIKFDFPTKIEAIVIEINLKKRKWLLIGSYNPHKNMIDDHLNNLGNCLDKLCKMYDSIILLGDFNSEMCEDAMQAFCNVYNLKSLINEPTCFKSIDNPSCIDLILTNKARSFIKSSVVETGLSDCHRLTITIMNTNFQKQTPNILSYRNYKYFNNAHFRIELLHELSNHEIFGMDYSKFENIFMNILNRHAPLKKRYLRANNAPFMNKNLTKAIMVRSRLRNKFLKYKTSESRDAYKKQRNYCVTLLRETKISFYENLNPKFIIDNKKFWKQVKPFFSDKTPSTSKIILVDGGEIISDSAKSAEVMNNFFSDAAINLDIDRTLNTKNIFGINDPVIKAIEKYKCHPSIIKILEQSFMQGTFHF